MKRQINFDNAVNKGILTKGQELPSDSLMLVDSLLNMIRVKYNVEILIQSGVFLDRQKPAQWQCIIGRQIHDYADAQIFSSGMGDSFDEAIVASINEFIEYFNIHKHDLIRPKQITNGQ